jgi:hypothetical protein
LNFAIDHPNLLADILHGRILLRAALPNDKPPNRHERERQPAMVMFFICMASSALF